MTKRTKVLLGLLNASRNANYHLDRPEMRIYFDNAFKREIKKPVGSTIITEIAGHPAKMYHPKKPTNDTIILFHGGGFCVGSIKTHDQLARQLCRYTGYNVTLCQYPLAPENPYPAAIDHAVNVLKNIKSTGKLIVAGDSAGGNIALHSLIKSGVKTDGLMLFYSALDPEMKSESYKKYATGYFVTLDDMRGFWSDYLQGNQQSILTSVPCDNYCVVILQEG
jgi:acetyl esterase